MIRSSSGGGYKDVWITITKKGRGRGEVLLELTFYHITSPRTPPVAAYVRQTPNPRSSIHPLPPRTAPALLPRENHVGANLDASPVSENEHSTHLILAESIPTHPHSSEPPRRPVRIPIDVRTAVHPHVLRGNLLQTFYWY